MSRRLWAKDGLFVYANLTEVGDLVITGQDLNHMDGYEYVITVRQPNVAKLVAALGGTTDAHPLGLLEDHAAEIVIKGERSWLQDHDIPLEFWCF